MSAPAPIEFHFLSTSNGQKVAIVLEETGLPYVPREVVRQLGSATGPEHLALNPSGKFPIIVDPAGPDGRPLTVFETMAICFYLAEKSGRLMPTDLRRRTAVYQWTSVAQGSVNTMMAAEFFLTRRAKTDVREAADFVVHDVHRGLHALNVRLGESEYLAGGGYSVADAIAYPTMATTIQRLEGGYTPYPHIGRWCRAVAIRPAIVRAMALVTGARSRG